MILHILHQNKASLFNLPIYNPISFLTFVFSTVGPRSKDLFRLLACPWMLKSILNAVLPLFSFLSSHDARSNFSCTFPTLAWELNSFAGNNLYMFWFFTEGKPQQLSRLYLCSCSPSIAPLTVASSKKELRRNFSLRIYQTSQHKLVHKNKRRN